MTPIIIMTLSQQELQYTKEILSILQQNNVEKQRNTVQQRKRKHQLYLQRGNLQ